MITAVDLFCGAGGTSTGLALATGGDYRLTAINHWDVAVETHAKNHPQAEHLCKGIDTLDPRKVHKVDAPRLQKAYRDSGQFLPADPRVLCILQLAMWMDYPGGLNLPNYKLSDVAARLGIPADGAHDALADCRIAASIMLQSLEGLTIEREERGHA